MSHGRRRTATNSPHRSVCAVRPRPRHRVLTPYHTHTLTNIAPSALALLAAYAASLPSRLPRRCPGQSYPAVTPTMHPNVRPATPSARAAPASALPGARRRPNSCFPLGSALHVEFMPSAYSVILRVLCVAFHACQIQILVPQVHTVKSDAPNLHALYLAAVNFEDQGRRNTIRDYVSPGQPLGTPLPKLGYPS
ncbi:hypothetical protein B0H13DRAFT_920931 [Mycena leptocephala]|nr:hypothetical protein B0H13DRAFT_920931 [Mycena leptocephala]